MEKTTDICYNLSRRKRVRVVEGARLERVYTAMYRRFESSRFRQEVKKTRKGIFVSFETRIRAQEHRFRGILKLNSLTLIQQCLP